MALLTCKCGVTCRLPNAPKGKMRCGKCQHIFTPMELTKLRLEEPPARVAPADPTQSGVPFELERQPDLDEEMSDEQCPECRMPLRGDGYCPSCGDWFDLEDQP